MNWSAAGSWFKCHVTLNNLFRLFLGQVASFAVALTSFTSSLIASHGVDAPITQTSFSYFSLAVVYGSILLYRRQRSLALGFVNVQGNYLGNKAFQFTSITSATLLDCCTIAWAIILTYIFMGTRYYLWQLLGAAICVLGLGLVLLSDAGVGGGGGSKPLLGDALVIAGTLFYSVSNVGEEFCVKEKDRVELVSMIGLFGTLVSGVELSIFEIESLQSVTWSTNIILAPFGFTVSSFMFYSITPFVLKLSGATMLNLSLLTSDMWVVVIRILFYRRLIGYIYFLAFALVAIGLLIYSITEKDPVPAPLAEDGNHCIQYQVLNDENMASRHE